MSGGRVVDSVAGCTTATVIQIHRWREPIRVGDPCYCGARVADAALVGVVNASGNGAEPERGQHEPQ